MTAITRLLSPVKMLQWKKAIKHTLQHLLESLILLVSDFGSPSVSVHILILHQLSLHGSAHILGR